MESCKGNENYRKTERDNRSEQKSRKLDRDRKKERKTRKIIRYREKEEKTPKVGTDRNNEEIPRKARRYWENEGKSRKTGSHKKENYRIITILLLMKCIRPVLREMIIKTATERTPQEEKSWTVDDFLSDCRRKVERKIQKMKHVNKYITVLYPSDSRTDFGEWDLKLMVFILKDICMVNENLRYYLEDILSIRKQVCCHRGTEVTRTVCKEYKRRLKSARSHLHKALGDHGLKQTVDRRVEKIKNGETQQFNVDDILERWGELETDRIKQGSSKSGIQKYLTINILLVESCTEVMKALVRRRVSELGFRSLDKLLQHYERRIRRRVGSLDTFGRAEELLLPPKGERTQIQKWDITLLCWVLLNVCFLDDALADAVGKLRIIRNEVVHQLFNSLNVSDADYEIYLEDIKRSISACLLHLNDSNFSKFIYQNIDEIEKSGMDKDETIRRLQMCQKDTAEYELQTQSLQGQASALQELSEMVRKFKGFEIPVCRLELISENCSQECEKQLSKILVEKINQVLSQEGTEKCGSGDELTTAVTEFIANYKSKGWKVLCAENGSVLLETQCESFDSLHELYKTHRGTGSRWSIGTVQETVRHLTGTQVRLFVVMHNVEMDESIAKIVTNLLERTNQVLAKVKQTKTENKTGVNIWMASNGKEELQDTSVTNDGDVVQRLTHIAGILKRSYNTSDISLTATLNDFSGQNYNKTNGNKKMVCAVSECGRNFPIKSSKTQRDTRVDGVHGGNKSNMICEENGKQENFSEENFEPDFREPVSLKKMNVVKQDTRIRERSMQSNCSMLDPASFFTAADKYIYENVSDMFKCFQHFPKELHKTSPLFETYEEDKLLCVLPPSIAIPAPPIITVGCTGEGISFFWKHVVSPLRSEHSDDEVKHNKHLPQQLDLPSNVRHRDMTYIPVVMIRNKHKETKCVRILHLHVYRSILGELLRQGKRLRIKGLVSEVGQGHAAAHKTAIQSLFGRDDTDLCDIAITGIHDKSQILISSLLKSMQQEKDFEQIYRKIINYILRSKQIG